MNRSSGVVSLDEIPLDGIYRLERGDDALVRGVAEVGAFGAFGAFDPGGAEGPISQFVAVLGECRVRKIRGRYRAVVGPRYLHRLRDAVASAAAVLGEYSTDWFALALWRGPADTKAGRLFGVDIHLDGRLLPDHLEMIGGEATS